LVYVDGIIAQNVFIVKSPRAYSQKILVLFSLSGYNSTTKNQGNIDVNGSNQTGRKSDRGDQTRPHGDHDGR